MGTPILAVLALTAVLSSAETTWSENLVLADCGIGRGPNGGSTSRQMMYYSDKAWGTPNWMVDVPWDGSYPWRAGGVTRTLPNGDTWNVYVNGSIHDPNLAGLATHTYDTAPLMCWSRHLDGLYTLDDGTPCSMAFICNHAPPPAPAPAPAPPPAPAPKPTPHFSYNVQDKTVALVGHRTPADIFNLVKYSGTGATYCADEVITIPDSAKFDKPGLPDCNIKFTCGPHNAKMMLDIAIQIAQKDNDLWKYQTQELDRCPMNSVCLNPQACVTTCEQGPDCVCGDQPRERDMTNVPGHVVIDKEGDAQSRFEYTIQCPNPQETKDCGICKAANVGAWALDLFTFGLTSVVVQGTCAMSGC